MKRLIINGDDFGISAGVVDAILTAHSAGVVSSTTALVNMPAWEEGAARLRRTRSLAAGVHLVFNAGTPVLPARQVPTLVDGAGRFLDDEALTHYGDQLDPEELRAEFRAQIERFRSAGLTPTHLDNHCSISYLNPDWFRAAVDVAAEYRLPMRMPFGDDLPEQAPIIARQRSLPAELVLAQGQAYQRMLAAAHVARPDRFLMGFSRDGGRTAENLVALLAALPEGLSELLTHPGFGAPWREQEMAALMDPRVRVAIREQGIELTDYRTLASVNR